MEKIKSLFLIKVSWPTKLKVIHILEWSPPTTGMEPTNYWNGAHQLLEWSPPTTGMEPTNYWNGAHQLLEWSPPVFFKKLAVVRFVRRFFLGKSI
jgi:hypothetical protein